MRFTTSGARQQLAAGPLARLPKTEVVRQLNEGRLRIAAVATLVDQARNDVDPEALGMEVLLRELNAAKQDGRDLPDALARAGVTDADGLWRVIEAMTTAAAQQTALWCLDHAGTSSVQLSHVLEYAVAFRPEALDRQRERMEQQDRDEMVYRS